MTARSHVVKAEDSVILLLDIQEKLLVAMSPEDQLEIVRNARTLLQAATTLSIPVIVTEQYPKGLGSTNTDIADSLPAQANIYEKTAFSAFQVDEVVEALRHYQHKQIILMGMETHICVLQTAFDLIEAGYQVFVVDDGVCSRAQQNHINAIKRLYQADMVITNTESVIFEWLKDAKHPDFRVLSKLIL